MPDVRPDGQRVTLQDVADRAGVSLTTASRVVNARTVTDRSRKVGKGLAERVQQAVAELGYTANLQARAVATGQSTMVGVALRDISDPYFSEIAAGLIEVADTEVTDGGRLLLCMTSTAANEDAEREYVALMRAQRARAVVLVGSRSDNTAARDALRAELQAFTRTGGRAACIGQDLLGVDTVAPGNRAGGEALARALAALGHKRFAVLAGPRSLLTVQDRAGGFLAGLSAWSVPLAETRVVHGDLSRDGGYAAMSEILAAGEPLPDCVFAVSDIMAVGALARLRAAGIDVPGDIALAGFDDIPTLRDVYPPLTTVRLPLKRLGEIAARLVLGHDAPARPRVVPVPGEVVLRDSTRPHPPRLVLRACHAFDIFTENRKALANDDEPAGSGNSPEVAMSEAAVPFSETKAPESADRLNRGALRLVDISASTMANIGPAYSFYFGAGFLFLTAGIAAPLTIIVAGVAIALLGNTLSQFSRAHPSTGGFISYVGKTFGGTSAVTTALLCGAGYIIAISSVLAICGGYLSMVLQYYFNVDIPWVYFSVIFTAGAMFMMYRGVAVSTKLAGLFFGFEMLVLIVVSLAALIKNGGHLSAVPFEPSHITNGFSGLAAGFPLAVYLFIGWENSAALAEETSEPRRNVPRAVFLSIALMVTGYVLYAYATATDFRYNVTALSGALIPFINVSHNIAAWLSFFAWMAGITSTLGVLISAVNSQARLIFNAGREGLLPRWLGRVHPVRRTPVNAMFAFVAIAAVIIAVWAILHLAGGSKQSGTMSALNFFVESSTMGTILVLVVYFLANLALPFYYRKYRPQEFNVVKHVVLPVLGMIAIGVPVYYLVKPGQSAPFNWFPYAALGVVVVSVLYAYVLSRRDPGLGERVGSIVADE